MAKETAQKIKALMEEKEYSYRILEDKTGISRSSIQRYVTGVKKDLKLDELTKIADALNVTTAYLLGWEEKKPAEEGELEKELIEIFRLVPKENRPLVLSMIKAAVKNL